MRRLFLVTAAVIGFTVSAAAQGPSLPYRDPGACPFECCTYRDWTANKDTTVYREMRDGSTRAFTVRKGEVVRGVTGVVITNRAGTATASSNMSIGQGNKTRVRKGDTLYLLTYQGEGFFKVWFKGRVIPDVEIDEREHVGHAEGHAGSEQEHGQRACDAAESGGEIQYERARA